MALMFEYKPGMDVTQPWALSPVRAQQAYQWTSSGFAQLVAANAIRDAHYINGQRVALFENASTNSLLQSNNLAAAAWSSFNNTTASANAGVAPDLTVNASAIQDNATNSTHYRAQGVTITPGENVAMSAYIKAGTHTKVLWYLVDSGTTTGVTCQVDLAAGTITAGTVGSAGAALTFGPTIVPLANGWFWVSVTGKVDSGTAASAFMFFYQVGGNSFANPTYAGDGTNCVFVWGCQMERYGTGIASPSTSLMPTVLATASRNADVVTLSTTWPFQTQPMWGYVKFLELGWAQRADFSEMTCFRDASSSGKGRLRLITGSGSAGATPSHRLNWGSGTGPSSANQNAAILTPGDPTWGDTVELFWRFYGTAKVEINRSINGGAVTTATGGPTAGVAFSDFAPATGAPVFSMLSGPLVGLISYKIGAGTSLVTTLAQAALA